MSRGIPLSTGNPITRGLKITRTTYLLVVVVAAGVASNAMVAMQFIGPLGQAILSVLIFAPIAVGTWAISSEIFSRSAQTISDLRSIGATNKSLSSAVMYPVLTYGAVGSVIGALAGTGVGVSIGALAGTGALLEVVAVIVVTSAASAVGVYAGGRSAWRS